MDRNFDTVQIVIIIVRSLSARRAWIEIKVSALRETVPRVALRKESVDRNNMVLQSFHPHKSSLSARRAWIEMEITGGSRLALDSRSPQGERG